MEPACHTSSPLLDLPTELRLQIWRYCIPQCIQYHSTRKDDVWNLFLVNKSIHAEAISEYYRHVTIQFGRKGSQFENCFPQAIRENDSIQHVRRLRFHTLRIDPQLLAMFKHVDTIIFYGHLFWEPFGTKPGKALEHSALSSSVPFESMDLAVAGIRQGLADNQDSDRQIDFRVTFTYIYSNRSYAETPPVHPTPRNKKIFTYSWQTNIFTEEPSTGAGPTLLTIYPRA